MRGKSCPLVFLCFHCEGDAVGKRVRLKGCNGKAEGDGSPVLTLALDYHGAARLRLQASIDVPYPVFSMRIDMMMSAARIDGRAAGLLRRKVGVGLPSTPTTTPTSRMLRTSTPLVPCCLRLAIAQSPRRSISMLSFHLPSIPNPILILTCPFFSPQCHLDHLLRGAKRLRPGA